MTSNTIKFRVTRLDAQVPEGVPLEWQGRQLESGPLTIELDEDSDGEGNRGILDYSEGRAQVDFRVRLSFPDLALSEIGVDPELAQPIRATLRSEGEILADHGFALSGRCDLRPHALFAPDSVAASVLPGQ